MEELGRSAAVKIKNPFTYLCCFNNIQSLRNEAQELEDARAELQRQVEAAESDAQVILPEVGTWPGNAREFDSRKQIEEDIMNALRGKKVTTMGICGMGGVGKTTMAKQIMGRAQKENIFHKIVMVVVSQQVDNLKIQGAIAESLDFGLHEETLSDRATKLRGRLTGEKKILIVFDDVWHTLKLEDLGIPCGNERCTILFTSRNKDVLIIMDVQKIYGVEILSETEAWFLFREETGSCVDDPNLLSIAQEVARECNCLPIALITVGGTLKNQTNITVWEDALQQLKSFNPEDLEDVIKDVYNPLKLSYTYLGSRQARKLFLLCGLFPENVHISLEELISYCIGLRMFPSLDFSNASEGILEKVRRRVFTIVDMLKNRFLLLEGRDEYHVRMHDVVRDVAIYIATKEAQEGLADVKFNLMHSSREYTYQWVSVFSEEISRLLRMDGRPREHFKIKDFSIFNEIKGLNSLSFNYIFLQSVPLEIQLIKNLRTLRLELCELESLSGVGELLSLEILCCRDCSGIEELPVEMGNLNQLKLLDFINCASLRRIPPGIISNLVELEELMITRSFNEWETVTYREQRGNAAISEIEHLENLKRLEIVIEDSTVVAEMMFLDERKVKYQIRFGGSHWESCELDDTRGFAKWVKDIVTGMAHLNYGICNYMWHHQVPPDDNFFRGLESIEIYDSSTGRLFHSLAAANLDGLKELRISKCKNMVKVIENAEQFLHVKLHALFPSLHSLYLEDLPKLESFGRSRELDLASLENVWIKSCHHLEFFAMQSVELCSLKKVVIRDCNNIGSLFPNMAANLHKLTTLSISRCKEMVQVVEKNDAESHILFHDLNELELCDLPKLQSFSNSDYDLELPSLENVQVKGCHRLEFFPMQNVQLRRLKKVVIIDCNHIVSLFSSSMAVDLHNLMTLSISGCKEMVQVIETNAERESDIREFSLVFHNLKELEFRHLPKLQNFCNPEYDLQLPALENVCNYSCPLWKKFSMGSLSTPNLKRVEINSKVNYTRTLW